LRSTSQGSGLDPENDNFFFKRGDIMGGIVFRFYSKRGEDLRDPPPTATVSEARQRDIFLACPVKGFRIFPSCAWLGCGRLDFGIFPLPTWLD
jgi:hypothetical protein